MLLDTITVMNISCVICWCLVSVPIVETEVLVTATPPDAKCQLSVGGKAAGEKTTLNIGDTLIEVTVGSIDGTVTKVSVCEPVVNVDSIFPHFL